MRKKATIPMNMDRAEPYVMRIADQLSDDPALISLLGSSFRVIVDYDVIRRRVTYSFRRPDDVEPGDEKAKVV